MKKKLTMVLAVVIVAVLALTACAPAAPAASASAEAPAEASTPASAEASAPAQSAEASASAGAADSGLPAADVAEQGIDYYDGAMTYAEAKEKLGPLPVSAEEVKIGYVCKAFENEFWRMQKEGAEKAAEDLKAAGMNITMDVRSAQAETDEQGQLAVMSDMINKKYNGLLVSPIAEGNLLPGVENAAKEGIAMTVVNDAFMPQIPVTVGAWHLEAAELAAQWVNEKIGGEGKVAIIQGLPKAPPARTRTEGFKNWFAKNNPKVEVVAIQNADWDRMKAKDVADVWMKQYPDLKAIYANNDTMAMGALEAVKAADKLGECLVVGTDGTSEARGSIEGGGLSATVDSFPYYMSQIGTEMLLRQIAGQDVPKVIYSPQAIIDSTNVKEDPAKLIGWTGIEVAK